MLRCLAWLSCSLRSWSHTCRKQKLPPTAHGNTLCFLASIAGKRHQISRSFRIGINRKSKHMHSLMPTGKRKNKALKSENLLLSFRAPPMDCMYKSRHISRALIIVITTVLLLLVAWLMNIAIPDQTDRLTTIGLLGRPATLRWQKTPLHFESLANETMLLYPFCG